MSIPPPPSRTAPQEIHVVGGGGGGVAPLPNGSVVVSVDQIITKLDIASEENVRLRNALHANNQLLDQKLKQFEPLVRENESK